MFNFEQKMWKIFSIFDDSNFKNSPSSLSKILEFKLKVAFILFNEDFYYPCQFILNFLLKIQILVLNLQRSINGLLILTY